MRRSAAQRDHRAGAGADAVDRRDDRLRAAADRLDEVAGHAREGEQLGHRHLRQRPDDLVHVAAGAEVAAGAGDDDGANVLGARQRAEQVAQLGVRLERQRILLLGAIEGHRRDAIDDLPAEVAGRVIGEARVLGHQSILAPENLTTCVHLSISALM